MKKKEKTKVRVLIKLCILITTVIMIAVITGCPAAATPDPDPDPVDTSIHVTGITLNKANTTILNGNSEQLTATIAPSDATDKSISWTSSDNAVATVTGGLVVGTGDGSATVTVTTVCCILK